MSADAISEAVFIREFTRELHNKNAAVFVGAGLSVGSGYVDWSTLLNEIIQDLGLDPESLDLVFAGFSLFFLRFWEFGQVWQRILQALKPGGIFAGQLLGVKDDWAERGYTVHTLEEVQSLLHPFEVLYFEEAERDGETLLREPKHWHVFHVVGRKIA